MQKIDLMTAESSQLVKCLVQNPAQQTSHRLIERDSFDLWYYLVSTKHNIKLLETSLCMWVNDDEFSAKEEIYRRAGDVERANRLMLMVFDDTGNYANTTRYVPAGDSQQLETILISHVPEAQRAEGQYSLQCDVGFLVVTGPLQQLKLLETASLSTTIPN
tara:strand:- start:41902 stop:42384 length:483 start_codon:yes stop_codon:yes gene_type:complete